MDLNFVRLVFTLKLEKECTDPYALFDLRPHFQEAFRQVVGCCQPQCVPCSKGETCPYHLTFAQHLSADPAALKRYQKPSLPFLFDIPVLPEPPNRGCTVELLLTITGPAINHVTVHIEAMERMLACAGLLRSVSASLLKVESADCGRARSSVMERSGSMSAGHLLILSLKGLQETLVLPVDHITLTIVTPMRILVEGKPARELTFSPFIRALFRRISSLAYYYGEDDVALDYKWIAERSRRVETVAVDFRWVEWGRRRSGLIGKGTFTGDMTEFHTFLLAGEYLHAGKGASFGLGSYITEKAAIPL